MALNLIELMNGYITPEVISKASTFIGENEKNTTAAVGNIVPSLLGGLLQKASDEEGAKSILQLLADGKHDGTILNNVLHIFNGGAATDTIIKNGSTALTFIFGETGVSGLANVISNSSNIQTSSATKLLKLVTPVLLGLIGKQTAGQDANGLTGLLFSQKDNVLAKAPNGFANVLGLFSLAEIGKNSSEWFSIAASNMAETTAATNTTATKTQEAAEETTDTTGGLMKWLLPLLLISIAIAAVLFFTKSCNKKPVDVAVTTPDSASVTVKDTVVTAPIVIAGKIDSATGEWLYDNGATIKIQLPNNGSTISAGANSTEAKLVAFLSGGEALDTLNGNWFDFTNVRFKTGGTETTPESAAQLKNLVAIVKAFPKAQFKIGGYTDNSGDAAQNTTLSQKRADAVAAQLVKLGAPKSSIVGTKGYGQEWPVGDNATAEGRAQNRRVSVNVKAK